MYDFKIGMILRGVFVLGMVEALKMEDLRAAEMETGGACRGYRGMRFTGQSPIWRRTVQDRGM